MSITNADDQIEQLEAEVERNRAAIAELVAALLLDEEVSHAGIISAANSGLLDKSQKMRRAAIAKHDTTTKEQ